MFSPLPQYETFIVLQEITGIKQLARAGVQVSQSLENPLEGTYCLPRTFLLFCCNIFRLREGRPPECAGAQGLSFEWNYYQWKLCCRSRRGSCREPRRFFHPARAALISIGKMTKVLTSPLSSRNSHSVPVCWSFQDLTQEFAVQTGCAWALFPEGAGPPQRFINSGSAENPQPLVLSLAGEAALLSRLARVRL